MVEVKLKVNFIEDQLLETNKYTLYAGVVEYVNIPREVFVFRKDLDGTTITFIALATPVRIEKLPITEPDHPGGFYRLHEVTLEFDQLEDRRTARSIMESKLQQLVLDWQELYPYVVNDEEVEFLASENT